MNSTKNNTESTNILSHQNEIFFCKLENLSNQYIHFHNIECRVQSTHYNDGDFLYFKERSKYNPNSYKYTNLGIFNKNFQGGSDLEVATFLNHFNYVKGFKNMFNDYNKYNNLFRIVLDNKNWDSGHGFTMNIQVYVKRTYFSDSIDKEKIPLLLFQIIKDTQNDSLNPSLINIETETIRYDDNKIDKSKYLRSPFDYQADNIRWLVDQEIKIEKKQLVIETYKLPDISKNSNNNLFFIDSIKEYLLVDNQENYINLDNLDKSNISIRGGVLADDVGLGKTFSIIGLIMERYINTNQPSLVICPSRLCKQWDEEFSKSCKLKTKIISSITQFRKLNETTLNSLDVIIMSYNFLTSPKYIEFYEKTENENNICVLHNFKWNRIILDEGHEYICVKSNKNKKINNIRNYLNKLNSNFRWICSGTPYSNYLNSWEILSYVCDFENNNEENKNNYHHVYDKLIQSVFRKNTKESVQNQISIPNPVIENDFLDMSQIERLIYDSALNNKEKRIELCNHILVSDEHINILGNKPLPLNEIYDKMTKYHNKQLEKYKTRIDNTQKSILKINTKIENMNNQFTQEIQLWWNSLDLLNELEKYKSYESSSEIIDSNLTEFINYNIPIDNLIDPEILKNLFNLTLKIKKFIYTQEKLEKDDIESKMLNLIMSQSKIQEMKSKIDDDLIKFDSDLDKEKDKIIEYQDLYTQNEAKLKIFLSLEEKIKETESCPICLDDLDNLTKTITPCGHFFCSTCITGVFNTNNSSLYTTKNKYLNCPLCRYKFSTQELTVIKPDIENLVEQLGTKMSHLINYLNNLLDDKSNRIIVFSRWDSMLKMISKVFNDKDINHIFLNGSINVLNGRIKKFKIDQNIRVVLLSSDKSPSGLNLTEANHVILLDTVNDEDSDSVRIIEQQAIGRAVRIGQKKQVQVKRFIMRNTIEHDYFLKHINE